jgi:ElaB/YqjD/DUF883 family membrane-anchored ribosome-binding protein
MQKQTGNSNTRTQGSNQNQSQNFGSQNRDQNHRDQGQQARGQDAQEHRGNQDQIESSDTKLADKAGDKAIDKSADKSSDKSADKLADKSGDKSSDKATDKVAGKSGGSTNLPEILQNFNTDEVKRYAERAIHYAEAKPMQTIGVTVAGGAILGWLLTSRSGRSAVSSVSTLVMPFIMSWVKQNVDFSKIGQDITDVVHH